LKTHVGCGSGKVILLGEHSVVYGHRAIAAAVSRGTRVVLTERGGATTLGDSAIRDHRLGLALAVALPDWGYRVDIETDLPVGCGMGSSAALTIALLRARASVEGRPADFAWLHREGFAVEAVFHGTPSGLDHAVSALGGAVLYRRDEEPLPIEMAPISGVVLNTGVAGDTAQLVAGVNAGRPGNEHLLQRLGQLVEERAPHLDDTAALGEAMNEAHGLLTELGVSTPLLDELVVLARRHGALGAKLSGAGGGGIVLALVDDPTSLLRAAKRRGLRALPLTLPSSEPA
jgi:mevalonate kinase